MAILYRVETYVEISAIFSLAALALISKILHREAFNLAAMFAAIGFLLSIFIACFLIADYTIGNENYINLTTIGKSAEGTIVSFEHMVDQGRGGRSRDCPIVQYIPNDGISRTISVHESHCSNSVDKRNLPLHVTVTYLETRPDVAMVLQWQSAPSPQERSIGFFCAACAIFFLWLYSAFL
jgi:Protein of unknown function (DUF3592)